MPTIKIKKMKINNIKYTIILMGLFINLSLFSQNLRWSFEVTTLSSTTSSVNIYLENISPTIAENINTFSTVFYYNDPMSIATSFDVSSTTSNLWPNNGTASSNLANVGTNGSVSITHNRFASINLTDTRLGTPGISIPPNSGQIHVLTINFTNQTPSSLGWLAETDEFIGLVYTDVDYNEYDIIVTGLQFAPLPITIKSFSATKDGERTARLDWTSSSEINSDYIGIERSTDGENWTTVGQVKAAGNSNRDIDYIYYDRSLPMARSIDNIFYYRLRLTDLDGQYKYSETRGVNMGRLEGLVSIYPNPATDIINVDLTDMDLHEGIIHLSVYDNTGKAIISKEVNGAGIEPIQASNMAAGSYQVVVKQGDTTHRKQIIVVN